ncbi:MFS transporter [Actinoallomurus purpureus]|uniref:MFS transporter n=1 Tax=Actinoallomurus purpureus TaxID=478114 RepID=UPI0020934484|nr:MFS transporter [Actinoallomurus purpureus]MCO6004745.1 MFS transporter [Actinoallomurus purpureus]
MSPSAAGALAVLRERDFRRFFIGQSASLLGDGMVGVALAFAVLDLTGSPADLGYVLAARSIPMVAGLLIGGVVADRLPRRRIMVTADLARFLGQGTMAALLIGGHATIWELVVLQAVHGTASALFIPASTGLVPAIVTGGRLQQANALRGLVLSVGKIAGPVLAGLLVAVAGPGWAIVADAATFGLSAITLILLRPPTHRPPPAQSFVRDLREGWTEFSSRTWLLTLVTAASLTNLLFAAFYVLGPATAAHSLGGPAAWATIQAVLGAGSLIGGITALHIHPRRPLRTGVLALPLSALPVIGLAAHLPVIPVAGLALLCGIGMTVFNTLMETALQHHVPEKALSRVSAYDWFGSFVCQPIGQATAGPLAAGLGTHPALWLAGVLQFLVALGALAVPAIRRLPAGIPDAPVPAHHES